MKTATTTKTVIAPMIFRNTNDSSASGASVVVVPGSLVDGLDSSVVESKLSVDDENFSVVVETNTPVVDFEG